MVAIREAVPFRRYDEMEADFEGPGAQAIPLAGYRAELSIGFRRRLLFWKLL